MGNQNGGAALQVFVQSSVDGCLYMHIHSARGIVQDEHGRTLQQYPRQSHSLTLPSGERVASLAHDGVVAFGKLVYELVYLSGGGSRDDFLACRIGASVGDVVGKRLGEQKRLVKHDAHMRAQAFKLQVSHILAVKAHRS